MDTPSPTPFSGQNPQAEVTDILAGSSSPMPTESAHHHSFSSHKKGIFIACAIVVVALALSYIILKRPHSTPTLSTEEKMQVLDYLEKETPPTVVDPGAQTSAVDALQEKAANRQ